MTSHEIWHASVDVNEKVTGFPHIQRISLYLISDHIECDRRVVDPKADFDTDRCQSEINLFILLFIWVNNQIFFKSPLEKLVYTILPNLITLLITIFPV